jgi:hypothetical protein
VHPELLPTGPWWKKKEEDVHQQLMYQPQLQCAAHFLSTMFT